jgi:opine dehydrogenase
MNPTVAVLGAGAGGTAAAVDLSLRGFGVRLWNRSASALDALADGIQYEGLLGDGTVRPQWLGTDVT